MPESKPLTPEEREICVELLQRLADDPARIAPDERLCALISKINRQGRKRQARIERAERLEADWKQLAETAMVQRDLRQKPFANAQAELPPEVQPRVVLRDPASCYVCKQPYTELHFHYHKLCLECAELNYARREQSADLRGRIALLTGGRVKIGFQLALRMLRDGARVVLTTRFPANAVGRFVAEPDYDEWRERLQIEGLDLRNLVAVEAFAKRFANTEPHLDILINNAAQTVRRPFSFYRHLLEGEPVPHLLEQLNGYADAMGELQALPPGETEEENGITQLSPYFPVGVLDADGQQVDLRPANSWGMRQTEVGTLELLEVHLVNAIAPFMLCRELKPLLLRSPFSRRFIVNVSAMEGQFARGTKTIFHPHTNMAKAALNRTSAAEFARDGIYMNSVDTGWITDEHPFDIRERHQNEDRFFTPLDVVDGMARVYDPVARGINEPGVPPFGHFLKDYAPFPW
jgi:NAD(P)-dependent dehydrogenase (short-subunit alcohol dehydrogenase family)